MATHLIGSGETFTTVQAWEDDIPATLTEQRIGQCKNQEFVVAGGVVVFSAHTTTASFNIILETASGASFQDNGSVRTNALRYNSANGAGLRCTDAYAKVIEITGNIGHLTVRKLQLKSDGGGTSGECVSYSAYHVATAHYYKDMIWEKVAGSDQIAFIRTNANTQIITCANILAIMRSSSGGGIKSGAGDNLFIGCVIIRPSNITAAGTGMLRTYDTPVLKSCAIFGFSTDCASGYGTTSNNNATSFSDAASGLPDPGTDNNQYSVSYTSTTPFVDADDTGGTFDFRLANDGNVLINAGIKDATEAPNDISGTVRADPPEIGVWELTAAVGRTTKNTRSNPLGIQAGWPRRMIMPKFSVTPIPIGRLAA